MNPTDPFGLVGQVLDGQFRVDRLVGEGGFSVVYKGHHQGLNEPIAVKCLKLPVALGTNLVEAFVQRFRDESRILYRLSQGNLHIVRSIAAGTTQAPATGALVPYMVLEWLEGRSLQNDFTVRRTTGQSGRPLDETIKLFETAADALGFAHAQGVVHRDVNAGNLFLSITAQGIKTKVLDFGVAKIMHDSALNLGPRAQTMGQLRIFAPAYGAPEQFDDRIGPVGAWSDVYSLALIMLEAMRDRPVNEGANLGAFAQIAIDASRRPTPRALGINVPDEVEAAFARATALDPRQRWQTATEFWKALTIGMNVASERKFEKAARETPPLASPQHQPQAPRGKELQRTMPLASSSLVRPGAPTVRAVTQRPPPVAGTGTTPGVPPVRTGSGSLPSGSVSVVNPSRVSNVPVPGMAGASGQGTFKSGKQTMALAGGPPRPPEVIADRAPPRIAQPPYEEDEEDEETRVNEAGPDMLRTLALIDAEKAQAAQAKAAAAAAQAALNNVHPPPPIEEAEEPTRFNPITVPPPEARPTVEPPEPHASQAPQGMAQGMAAPPGNNPLGGTFMMAPQRPSHPQPAPSVSAVYTPPATTPSQGTGVPYGGQSQVAALPHGSHAGPPPQDPRFSQMQGPQGMPYGQQPQGYPQAPNATDASPWARHSIDQAAPSMIQAQPPPPPAKKSPVLVIAIVSCGLLALGGIGLTAYAVTARRAHVPAPVASASVSASAEPMASAVAPPVEKAAETPPVATAAEADAAPAVAEAPDAAPAAPEEPPAASASAAPSTTAAPTATTAPTHTAPAITTAAPATAVPVPVPTPKATASAAPAADPNAWNEANARSRLATANGVLVICKKGNVTGPGTASVTFGTDGTVTNVTIDPPYAGTKEGDCAAGQFRRVKVNPFVGSPQTVRHSFDVPK
ncbi:serine/threonine protein kinase [Labilithrix luteola]|uniref:Serine/threonine protein kinase n=1 Tax=Labilithrix luteola TaxID=1391654 RepID=A0A0K1Q1I6_9BACT|nr:serine/threonine-protein kinase [Labilithrix luteola]AKU99259.1 serine/threonine protein kinase [Labilithrix luteola]